MQIIVIVLPFNMAAVQNLYMPRETKQVQNVISWRFGGKEHQRKY